VRGEEAFTESGEVQFVLMFLSEQISRIADSRMVLEIYLPMLDCFAYCIFSDIEVTKIIDGCGLGPIYTPLIVIADGSWSVHAMHVKVAENAVKMMSYAGSFIS
jgi:hypothetical protein